MTSPIGAYSQSGGIAHAQQQLMFYLPMDPSSATTRSNLGMYPVGAFILNTTNGNLWVLKSYSTSAGITSANWSLISVSAGELDTLTGNTGGPITPSAGNINVLGGSLTSVAGSGHTLTINTTSGGYPITPYVVGPVGKAGYQTIQSAINAANGAGGGLVAIQPGTYTENLTFYSGIIVQGASPSDTIIVGAHTPPTSGAISLFRCALQHSSHVFTSAASGTATINVEDCSFTVTSGYSFDLANWAGAVQLFDTAALGTTDGFINNTGGAALYLFEASVGNGTANAMITSGTVLWQGCRVGCPISMQTGTSLAVDISQFFGTVTIGNNSTGTFDHCKFYTGSSVAITMSSSAAVGISSSTIYSTHTPAVGGSGAGLLTITNTSLIGNYGLDTSLNLGSKNIRGGNFLSQYVVALDGTAPYTVIQTAMNDASTEYLATGTPQVVYVKPGAYTENLTFHDGVDLHGALGQVDTKFLTITGLHTLPASGEMGTYGIWYLGTTACFTAAPAGTCKINMFNVITQISGVGYTFDISGYAGEINIFDYLQFDGGTNGFVNNPTGGCEVNIIFAGVGLSPSSATAIISGNSFFQGMLVSINMHFVGTSYTQLNMGCELQGTISTSNSASIDIANTYSFCGSSPAISHGSSGTVTLTNYGVNTSANPAIAGAGAGVVSLTGVDFVNSSTIANTLTLTGGNTKTGSITALSGAITASNGNLVLGTAGNKLSITAGSNASVGVTAAMTAGSIAVSTTAVTSNSIILYSVVTPGGTPGTYTLTKSAGSSFTITSTSNNETSTFNYLIIN